jgi:hypothetical protein
VARPIKVPIRRAKLKNPILFQFRYISLESSPTRSSSKSLLRRTSIEIKIRIYLKDVVPSETNFTFKYKM